MYGTYKPIIEAYFKENGLVRHHVKSFNDFIDTGMQSVVSEIGEIKPELEGFKIKLGKVSVQEPVIREADGSTRKLYPYEARLRDRTYAAPINLEMTSVYNDKEEDTLDVTIGRIPVMLKSKICLLNSLTDDELRSHKEDPNDPGGYFIINGTERVLVLIEDLASNRVLVERNKINDTDVAKLFSARGWYRRPCTLERKSDGDLLLSFPPLLKPLPVIAVLKALGFKTDREISAAITKDEDILEELYLSFEGVAEVKTQDDALDFIGKKVAVGQQKPQRIERAEHVLDRYLLPHIGMEKENRIMKAYFLAKMTEKLMKFSLGHAGADDKDNYANKRLHLAGDLLEDVFRVALRGLTANAVYSLEKAAKRERKLSIRTAIRSSLLSDRIGHAMATGAWVGGRQGVSQHLDRLNYVATISHLRRVRSLLSRTQPHFEARDLHSTHWGKLCPNETPEGSNIGLVKNLSFTAEISTGTDTKPIEEMVYQLGVKSKW